MSKVATVIVSATLLVAATLAAGKPLPPGDAPDVAGSHLDPSDPANIPWLWHKGADFEKGGTSIPLLFRCGRQRGPSASHACAFAVCCALATCMLMRMPWPANVACNIWIFPM